jgi:uncharacterized protein YecE (DUF72 family)
MSEAAEATRHRAASRGPTRHGRVCIGISGWRYAGWRGDFYPARLRQDDELSYASRHFDTIEINGTHYSLQRPASFAHWHDETPDDFVFAVKASRFITHMKQLRDIEKPLANFFAQGVLRLGGKIGPFLWQFSPRFRFDAAKLDAFLGMLPRTTEAAAALARHHDHRLAGRAWTKAETRMKLRHAIEIRHPRFLDPDFVALLRRHHVALVFADAVDWPYAEDVTADFLYLRLHGSEELYASGYSDDARSLGGAHPLLERRRRAERRQADRPGPASPSPAARRLRLFRQRRQGARPLRRANAAPQTLGAQSAMNRSILR